MDDKDYFIDISGIDKLLLLAAMWYASFPLLGRTLWDRYAIHEHDTVFDRRAGEIAVKSGYIGILQGRPIRADLTRDYVDPREYDARSRKGRLAELVCELKRKIAEEGYFDS